MDRFLAAEGPAVELITRTRGVRTNLRRACGKPYGTAAASS